MEWGGVQRHDRELPQVTDPHGAYHDGDQMHLGKSNGTIGNYLQMTDPHNFHHDGDQQEFGKSDGTIENYTLK